MIVLAEYYYERASTGYMRLLGDALGDLESAFREAVRLTIEVMKFLIEAMRMQL